MIIKEQNGWKLIKDDSGKVSTYSIQLPSGEIDKLNTNWSGQAEGQFNRAVERGWTWLKRTYYTVSHVKSKIKVTKQESNMVRSDSIDKFERSHYMTEAQARQAINDVLPRAEKHFKECLEAYQRLTKELNFSVGFNYDGDTHGIYNEYDYISFKMDGFNFQFEIER